MCVVITCRALVAPENGFLFLDLVENDQYFAGDIVIFACANGFELVGSPNLVCQSDGEWTGEEPTCKREYQCTAQRKF